MFSMSILVGSTIPICQFGLSLIIFGPVLTWFILTVFYIYVDGDEDGGGGRLCDLI